MTAIRATYSDLKLVKTRKVLQLIFEVPIEEADNALRVLGGMPRADAETWVAIAPITEEAATRAPTPADKPRRRMAELSRAQQAGILCKDERFQQWIFGEFGSPVPPDTDPAEWAAVKVRAECHVESRSMLNDKFNDDAAERWDQLRTEFDAWTGKIGWPEPEGMR